MNNVRMTKDELLNFQLSEDDFETTIDGVLIKYNSNIIKKILHDQALSNELKRTHQLKEEKNNAITTIHNRCAEKLKLEQDSKTNAEIVKKVIELKKELDNRYTKGECNISAQDEIRLKLQSILKETT